TPSTPLPGQTLDLSYTWSDADAGDIEKDTEISWYKNAVLQPAFNNLKSIDGIYVLKDDIWNVTVRPKDGVDFGDLVFVMVTIGNTIPEILTSSITPITAYTDTLLYANSSFSQLLIFYDADADSITWLEYKWFINNVENATYYNQSSIPANATIKGDQWRFTVQIGDGRSVSNIFSSVTIIILNTPPVLNDLSISAGYSILYTNNSLDLSWNYSDADLDTEAIALIKITWFKNGLEQLGLANLTNIPSSLVSKGDLWMVRVQTYDGYDYSSIYSYGPITIQNTPGIINNVNLNNNEVLINVTSDLNLDWIFFDGDGDGASSLNITWFKSTDTGVTWVHQSNWNNQSAINSINLTKGEAWFANLSIFDGETWSLVYQSQIINIINAIPQVDSIVFTNTKFQHFLVEDEVIRISYAFFDPDVSDNDLSKIMWFINGVYQPQYDNLTLIPASETSVGQVWLFQVLPYDGENSGIVITSEEKVIEDIPDILNYGVNPLTSSEGHYLFWFEVNATPVNPLISLPVINVDIFVNNTDSISVTANSNGSHFTYEWKYTDFSMIGSNVSVVVIASSSVIYNDVTTIITNSLSFEFLMLDNAPPRVKDVTVVLDNDENPNNLTFYVLVEEFGSGIDNATIYYAFESPSDLHESVTGPASSSTIKLKVMQSDVPSEDFQAVSLTQLNATHYWASIEFKPNSPVLVLYR
ncbi:MAG: hypothetical protein ACXAC2_23430, partial [Candidatus Kariarchaeaceae archaeon]